MNRKLFSLGLIAILGSTAAFGQSDIPDVSTLSTTDAVEAWKNERVQALESLPFRATGANKQTSSQVLVTEKMYDYNVPNHLTASGRYSYSNGRGSTFDYNRLDYGGIWKNYTPDPITTYNCHVDFDTVFYDNGKVGGVQSYNSANKPISYVTSSNIYLWKYDGSNRPVSKTNILFNTATHVFDTASRTFYRYDASGNLVTDSIMNWSVTKQKWDTGARYVYTNDASGRITYASYERYFNGHYEILDGHELTYTGTSMLPSSYSRKSMVNSNWVYYTKTDYVYSGNVLIQREDFSWKTATSSWSSNGKEFRHLNAAGLPDSVYYSYSNTYIKLAYASQNNPQFKTEYHNDTVYRESRWTYDPDESTSVSSVKTERLEFYPNPAKDEIQLKGLTIGSYSILNAAGQLVQSGKLNGGAIPVQALIPGLYILNVQDGKGLVSTGRFVKE
jgi:hypothetical protein